MSGILETIIIFIVAVMSSFVPMNEEGVVVDFDQVTTETTVIVCEYENKTNRIINEPHISALSKKVDGEWQTVVNIPIPEASSRVMPGRRDLLCKFNIEHYTGEMHLEAGEYKFTLVYDIRLFDESIPMSIDIPFTVVEA